MKIQLTLMVFGSLAVTFAAEPYLKGVNACSATDEKTIPALNLCLKVQ